MTDEQDGQEEKKAKEEREKNALSDLFSIYRLLDRAEDQNNQSNAYLERIEKLSEKSSDMSKNQMLNALRWLEAIGRALGYIQGSLFNLEICAFIITGIVAVYALIDFVPWLWVVIVWLYENAP